MHRTIPLREIRGSPSAQTEPDAETTFRHLLAWVGQGVEAMAQIQDEELREQVFALLEGIDLIHRRGIQRLLTLVETAGERGEQVRSTRDPIVHSLLEMYDLLTLEEREQVERALQPVYPYVESHGGRLELLAVDGGEVRVRLSGACGGCPGAAGTLQRVVEEALREGFPGFTALVAEAPPPPDRVPIRLGETILRRPRWVDVGALDEFAPGKLHAVWPEGSAVLVVRIGDEVYAHHNGCPPGSALGLHLGELDGSTIICPWHRCRYDARTGKRLDADGRLAVLPVAVRDGMVKVAMGVEEVHPA